MALNPRERTIAIALGGLVGAFVLYTVLIEPLLDRLAKADTTIAAANAAADDAATISARRMNESKRWREITADTLKTSQQDAEGQLVNRVNELARTSGLALDSLKPDRTEKEKDFMRVAIRATASGSMSQVKRFLDGLRTTDVPVKVTELTLASRKDGQDDVNVQVGIATIYAPPPPPASATPGGAAAPAAAKEATR